MGAYDRGKQIGQEVPGGVGLVAEKGPEKMKTKNGQEYMVTSPSVVPLGRDDEVTSRLETSRMAKQNTQADLNQLQEMKNSQDQFMQGMREDREMLKTAIDKLASRPVDVILNKEKVGRANADYLKKKGLRLA